MDTREEFYCLADIAVLEPEQDDEDVIWELSFENQSFRHEGRNYRLLEDIGDHKMLLADIKRLPEYNLHHRTDCSDGTPVFLSLFLRKIPAGDYANCPVQRRRMVERFFEEVNRQDFVRLEELQLCEATETGEPLSIAQFYDRLRERHTADVLSESIPEDVAHESLRPTLRPYQVNAIRWMLDRETNPKTLPAQYATLRCPNVANVEFYMYLDTYEVVDVKPRDITVPPGGILADEMGMGKTVEILGLMLYNKKRKRKFQETVQDAVQVPVPPKKGLKCICIKGKKETIQCQKCGRAQHKACVLKNTVRDPVRYICPECWRSEPLVESSTTIIVSPVSIKMQWASEIKKHISDKSFKIFVYEGVHESGWISPADLAEYDAVLTDYNVLSSEIHYANVNARTSRHGKRFLSPVSPLPLVRWWRVCLDEAQMVEGVHNQPTRMVKTLPAVHRWTVTGTPIEKSMDNLYGLAHFLDYAPYDDFRIWKEFTNPFQYGNPGPLVTAMARIMWRTSKAAVLDQLNIPPQTEVVHYITMCDLQRLFYRAEHTKCSTAFREKAAKLGRELSMSRMKVYTLNQLMEPLRKLRQDCTIPSVLYRSDQSSKKLHTTKELWEHLVSKTENECKSALRSVVSSINGMAGVHVLRKEFDQAIKLYKSALRWAEDYQGTICVDSLLQIHALYNLTDVLQMTGLFNADEFKDFEERCSKLEWKYLETYSNLVKNVESDRVAATEKVHETLNGLQDDINGNWWRQVIHHLDKDSARAANHLLKLNVEIKNHNGMAEEVRSFRGLDYTLVVWLDKVRKQREELQEAFSDMEFFSTNIKPKHLWQAEVAAEIEELIQTAFLCHLDPKNGDLTARERMLRPTCLLCEVKRTLNHYECVIFQKNFSETTNITQGSWKTTEYELILKILHTTAKKELLDESIIETGQLYLSYLESVREEFKQYSKCWVEINYAVAAFDELNMCRSRLEIISEDELEASNGKRSIQQVFDYEIHDMFEDQNEQKQASEREFVRLKGTLKYLQHLGSANELEVCPICQNLPEVKYVVLQCGHHVCMVCSTQMLKMAQFNFINCVVCRHRQSVKDIYHVTCIPTEEQEITVKGNYSSKIMNIVETIIRLKIKEPDVKIIIFSHWDYILYVLAGALDTNSVTYRMKSAKFDKHIEEFKDYGNNITCMLLPLKYGSKGLNLIEATHVFLVEPILNPGEELQAVGRVHRIGQTRPTFVHRFIVQNTIEDTIHKTIQNDSSGRWTSNNVTVEHLEQLFRLDDPQEVVELY